MHTDQSIFKVQLVHKYKLIQIDEVSRQIERDVGIPHIKFILIYFCERLKIRIHFNEIKLIKVAWPKNYVTMMTAQ